MSPNVGGLGCRLRVNNANSWLQKDQLKPNHRLHTAELIGYTVQVPLRRGRAALEAQPSNRREGTGV